MLTKSLLTWSGFATPQLNNALACKTVISFVPPRERDLQGLRASSRISYSILFYSLTGLSGLETKLVLNAELEVKYLLIDGDVAFALKLIGLSILLVEDIWADIRSLNLTSFVCKALTEA